MARAAINRIGAQAVSQFGAVIYVADPAAVDVSGLGDVVGVPWAAYPVDDGREDWRADYVRAVRDSMAMPTPRTAPAKVRASAVAKGARAGLRS